MQLSKRATNLLYLFIIFTLGSVYLNIRLGDAYFYEVVLPKYLPTPYIAPIPTPTQPSLLPTTKFKQVVYQVYLVIDENNNNAFDNGEPTMLDYPMVIHMSEREFLTLIVSTEINGNGQIMVVRNYNADETVDPYAFLPDDYQAPINVDNGKIFLCPDPDAESQRISIDEEITENGDLIITYTDVFIFPVCTSSGPTT